MHLTTGKPTFEGSIPSQIQSVQINGNDLAGEVIVETESPYSDESFLGRVNFANPKTRPYFVILTDERRQLVSQTNDANGFDVSIYGDDTLSSGRHRFTYQIFEYDAQSEE